MQLTLDLYTDLWRKLWMVVFPRHVPEIASLSFDFHFVVFDTMDDLDL